MDINKYLTPLSDDNPCGDDLEYDPIFREMELAIEGRPERQMGDEVQPSEEPDWRKVKKLALDLLKKTRDVRVAVTLTQSLMQTDGFQGLADGLNLNLGLLDKFWDCVYPQQDPEDDYPISRMNALMTLGDSGAMTRYIRRIPLVEVKGIGQFSLLDIDISEGKIKPGKDNTDPPTESVISAAFSGANSDPAEQEKLEKKAGLISRCLETLKSITELLNKKVGAQNTPDFEALRNTFQNIQKVYGKHIPLQLASSGDSGTGDVVTDQIRSNDNSGIIQSRDQALKMMDSVCDYFVHFEPSSPVPLLLRRAKRLVNKDFIEILEDIVPESVAQAENITGSVKK